MLSMCYRNGMATVNIRDVPDEVYEGIKERARISGRTIASEVRHALELHAGRRERPLQEVIASISVLQARYASRPVDVDAIIRGAREER